MIVCGTRLPASNRHAEVQGRALNEDAPISTCEVHVGRAGQLTQTQASRVRCPLIPMRGDSVAGVSATRAVEAARNWDFATKTAGRFMSHPQCRLDDGQWRRLRVDASMQEITSARQYDPRARPPSH